VPVLILGGVLTAGAAPALAYLSTTPNTLATPTYCNVINGGSYTTNPSTTGYPQNSVFVTRISYTNIGPIHEIGTAADNVNTNTEAQPRVLNSKLAYSSTLTAGMTSSAGMYTGIYTLAAAPAGGRASYFIPTMGVKGTLVATYYTGTVTQSATFDVDTLTACFSGDGIHYIILHFLLLFLNSFLELLSFTCISIV
jgi:hypothetical protein